MFYSEVAKARRKFEKAAGWENKVAQK